METPIAPIDSPSRGFIATEQALLVQACVGPGTVELVAAVQHAAQAVAAFLSEPGHHLLERGDNVHILGNQCHRRLPDVVIKTSHH
ncbi:MAG: hypothetical protein Q8N52_06505 [Acidobacteriota bacterium]|nr:hypothetical protein [Acidobacteriota bacterium]